MYTAVVQPAPYFMNGIGAGIMDGSGFINPAALDTSGSSYKPVLPASSGNNAIDTTSRGVKRSRSPERYGDNVGDGGDDDESKPRKRGRPPKSKAPENPVSIANNAASAPQQPVQTPRIKSQGLSHSSPTQASPAKSTPTKTPVLKALPTVRDHTTDQLGPEGVEFIPREYDEAGEKKVTNTGHLMDGREYRCRTFFVPNRGDKLFMLATECARVLGYRDSYLLFNKNRSLYKIIASQAEKDDLIHQEILPYSYRSRQIAIVTAKSMFRQFGSRVIVNGRRVRDDYWESKAKKQGFTEEDLAGEKRPGAAKQREAAAAEAAHANVHGLTALPHYEIEYRDPTQMQPPFPVQAGSPLAHMNPTSQPPLPMINLAPTLNRPRHEITGQAYQDRTQPAPPDLLSQTAHSTAEFNKQLGQQRNKSAQYLNDYWNRKHEPPLLQPVQQSLVEAEPLPTTVQPHPSPQLRSNPPITGHQQSMPPYQQSTPSQMMTPQSYSQPPHQQSMVPQSPNRSVHQPIRSEQMHHRSPSYSLPGSSMGVQPQPSPYYTQNQMWPPPQPQPSPHQHQQPSVPSYGSHPQQQQQSPVHPHQSPHLMTPQLQGQNSGQMPSAPMGYTGMVGMGPGAYPSIGMGIGRNMFHPSPAPANYMQPSTSGSQQPGMQTWTPQGQGGQTWSGY